MVSVYRKAQFNSAHRLFRKDWSDEKNNMIFGLCNNPNYHGHNYQLIVKLTGEINPETGYVFDLKELKKIIDDEVIELFDHKNLNLDTAEFRELIPTAENICVVIWKKIRARIDLKYAVSVKLYETERNFVKFSGN